MSSEDREANSELESFRKQWISDLQSRAHEAEASSSSTAAAPAVTSRPRRRTGPSSPTIAKKHLPAVEDDEYYLHGPTFDSMPPPSSSGHLLSDPPGKHEHDEKPLVSALDHYEKAMEKEAQGNMGESLKLYRQAYRLDHRVDMSYREKHFPTGFAPAKATPSSSGAVTAPPAASHKPAAPPTTEEEPQPLTLEELIASFSGLKIEGAPPIIENTPPPPCPISNLPDELLVHILGDVAVADVGDFARLSLVCKRFAYLVATEQRIWRRVCLGTEFGFTSMPRHWQKTVEWEQLEAQEEADEDGFLVSMREVEERRLADALSLTTSLHDTAVYPSWKNMFRTRPRIRFNGCYISTVNYIRTGQATNQAVWGGDPYLIVTYYRYLRFFRDGTAISLLTTTSPADVVHHLTPELLKLHREAPHAHLPSAMMHQALKGRWRQSSALDYPDNTDPKEQESDLYVETEGVGAKYMYRMDLSLRSAGKGTRNNKIVWRSFSSYNKLTDDWADFQLKNDKPFFFSRVKSYGVGESA